MPSCIFPKKFKFAPPYYTFLIKCYVKCCGLITYISGLIGSYAAIGVQNSRHLVSCCVTQHFGFWRIMIWWIISLDLLGHHHEVKAFKNRVKVRLTRLSWGEQLEFLNPSHCICYQFLFIIWHLLVKEVKDNKFRWNVTEMSTDSIQYCISSLCLEDPVLYEVISKADCGTVPTC